MSADGLPLLSSEAAPAAAVPGQATGAGVLGAGGRGPGASAGAGGTGAGNGKGPQGALADLATVVSGLGAITAGAAELMEAGGVKQTLVAMADGNLMVMSISDGSLLGVHTEPDADPGQVAYHMAVFVGRAGHLLTPELRARLREGSESLTERPA